jgi:nucleoid-associated protein YgaU
MALVIGVGLVIAVAVVFFHKELIAPRAADDKPPANVNPPPAPPAEPEERPQRTVAARPVGRTADTVARRQHVVAEGETLYGLAQRYYGDGERFVELYRANRDVLHRPERLEEGTVLVIPDVAEAPGAAPTPDRP